MNSVTKCVAAALAAGILTAALATPAMAASTTAQIRVSSYKGTNLQAGERSGLIIGGSAQAVTSDSPETVTVENVGGFWVAVAKSGGTAVLTATGSHGETASLTLTVGDSTASGSQTISEAPAPVTELDAVRQEIIRLVNAVRRENSVPELAVDDRLMTAAQVCSDRRYTWHHNREECEAVSASGYPHGFGSNLTVFTGAATADIAQRAVTNWENSPGHLQTMLTADADSIGVGVTVQDGVTYCYLFVGRPNTVNPYR